MRLETELQVLRAFTPAVRAELPFLIPHVAGTVRLGDLRTFVYSHIEGSPRSLDELAKGGRELAREIGRAIAAVHELPRTLVNEADLPGLRMPGEYDVTYDRDAGTVTIESGPEAGTVVHPNPRVIDALERTEPGSVVRDTVDRYTDAGRDDGT